MSEILRSLQVSVAKPAENADRAKFASAVHVSRETLERFDVYVSLLQKWQSAINLVSSSTLKDVWSRHFLDSAQVQQARPEAKTWIDLGSGAGFPGLVIALLLADLEGTAVHLVEIDQRKCTFLREVIRATGAPAIVHQGSLASIVPDLSADAVTSRALARLDLLVEWSLPLLNQGTKAVFLKGRDVASELRAIMAIQNIKVETRPSQTDAEARLVLIEQVSQQSDLHVN